MNDFIKATFIVYGALLLTALIGIAMMFTFANPFGG